MKKQENSKPKFLIDQNIGFKTINFLRGLGFDVKSLADVSLRGKEDIEIIQTAQRAGRIVITFDKDFGEIYYFSSNSDISVIILYLDDQTSENVNTVLKTFESVDFEHIKNKLVILCELPATKVAGVLLSSCELQ